MLANCRSMLLKIEAISDYFENNCLKFGMLTETWTDKASEKRIKEKLEYEYGLGILMHSRTKKGGGVALVFKPNDIQFKSHRLFTGEYEILSASARLPAANTNLYVFCVYYPPRMLVEQVKKMNEIIYDEIVRIKVKEERPLFIVAGDMNKKDCDCFAYFGDIKIIDTAPTRAGATLDLCFTNIFVESNNVSIPLWSTKDTESDHRVVLFDAAFIGQKHTYSTIVRRKFTKKAEEKFCEMFESIDWSEIEKEDGVEKKTAFLHNKIEGLKDLCFPMKRTRIRSDEDPWITDHIRKLTKKRNATFQQDGREESWKVLRDEVRDKMELSKKAYYDREVDKIMNSTNKKALAFTALKNINCAGKPKTWSVTDMDRSKSEEEIVEELAVYFNSVTADYEMMDTEKVSLTFDRPLYPITTDMVEQRILSSKKPNSTVPGDIPPKLVSRLAKSIAVPACSIFNEVARTIVWPSLWKQEYQTIIPKKPNPTDFSQLRNLSCTNFLSKVLESFLIDSIQSEIDLSDLQYGGIKGCGTDNFLVEMWNNILETLDRPDSAISLMSVDFSKAFNRMSHQACLEKLVKKNASNQTIQLVAAFLKNRQMCVRSNNHTSKNHLVRGGSPQGTKLGNLLFCIAIDDITRYKESNAENSLEFSPEASPERAIPPQYLPHFSSTPARQNQFDDQLDDSFDPNPHCFRNKKNVINDTLPFNLLSKSCYGEAETWEIGYIDDLNVGETLRVSEGIVHITTGKEMREIRSIGCEDMYGVIESNGKEIGMVIHPEKTQLLCINTCKDYEVTSFVSIGERKIKSGKSMKILGFMFDDSPTPKAHVEYLLEKYNRSLWSLFHLKRAKMTEEVLTGVYKAMIRPLLEYGSNVIYSMLNEEMKESLERCQNTALRIIYGLKLSPSEMREKCNIPSLELRRRTLFEKFSNKMRKSERFQKKWLPRRDPESELNLRNRKEFIEFFARTDRLFKSPLFAMRRFLNNVD